MLLNEQCIIGIYGSVVVNVGRKLHKFARRRSLSGGILQDREGVAVFDYTVAAICSALNVAVDKHIEDLGYLSGGGVGLAAFAVLLTVTVLLFQSLTVKLYPDDDIPFITV